MDRTKMPNRLNGNKGGFEPGLPRMRVRRSPAELPRSTAAYYCSQNLAYHGMTIFVFLNPIDYSIRWHWATRSSGSLHISFKLSPVHSFTSSNHCHAGLPLDLLPSTCQDYSMNIPLTHRCFKHSAGLEIRGLRFVPVSGFLWMACLKNCVIMYRQNYVTKEKFSLTMSR